MRSSISKTLFTAFPLFVIFILFITVPAVYPSDIPDPCGGSGCGCIGPNCGDTGERPLGGNIEYPPPPTPRELAMNAYNSGNYHYQAGNWAEAEKYYLEALDLYQNFSGDIYYKLGNVLEAQRRYDEALAWYRKAQHLGVHSILDGKTNIERIEDILEREAGRRNAINLNEQGKDHYMQGDFEKAVEFFQNAINNDPNNAEIQKNLEDAEAALLKQKNLAASSRIEKNIEKQIDALENEWSSEDTPVDLSFTDPDELPAIVPETEAEVQKHKGLRIKDVPAPFGYKSKGEREAQLAILTELSDDELNKRIERTTRTLEYMLSDFLKGEKELNEWLAEAQDAEEKALIASFKMMAASALKLPGIKKIDDKALLRIKQLSEKGLTVLDYGDPVIKFNNNPSDREANLELARNTANDLYNILSEHQDVYFDKKTISKLGPEYAGFGGFLVDYIYEASRWAVAGAQIRSITDNIDKPKGKLDAQMKMKRILEDLINEQKQRGGK